MTQKFFFLCSFAFVFVCTSCDGKALFEGYGEFHFKKKTSDGKQMERCVIEGKKLSVYEENVEADFWSRLYFSIGAKNLNRVYRFAYENESEKEFFGTYQFPVTTGIGAIHENTGMVVVETSDLITIFYNKEPVDGFFIEKNPFSKKILFVFKSRLSELKRKEGVCFYYI